MGQLMRKFLLAGMLATVGVWAHALAQELPLANEDADIAASEVIETVSNSPYPEDQLEAFFDGAVATTQVANQIPGITVSVVYDGERVFSKGYGYIDVERQTRVDPATSLFRIGSISKPFTWTAVMQLVEQGRLDLDADVNEYISAFSIPEAFDAPVTLRHILTHTAGFEDGGAGYLFSDSVDDEIGLEEWLARHVPARVRAPGTYSAYSNYATALAGYIVSEVSGVRFETYIRDNILTPLEMNHSTFEEPIPDRISEFQSVHFRRTAGDFRDGGFEFIQDAGPAGSMSASADDMAKFMIAHLGDGSYQNGRILSPETTLLMRSRLHSHNENIPGMSYGFFEYNINGHFGYGHGGDTIAFHSDMVLIPSENLGVFISSNAPDGALAVRLLMAAFFDEFLPRDAEYQHPAPPTEDGASKENLKALAKYAGTYRGNRRSYTNWEKIIALGGDTIISVSDQGGLVMPAFGGGSQRYIATDAEHVFRSVDDPDDLFAFEVNDQGQVTHAYMGSGFAFERVGSFGSAQLHQMVLGIGLLIFICVVASSLWTIRKFAGFSRDEKFARATLFGASLSNVLFIVLFALGFSVGIEKLIFNGLSNGPLILTLPFIALLFAIGAVFMAYQLWRQGERGLWARIRYTLVVIVLVLFALVLNYWNLLGPWNL